MQFDFYLKLILVTSFLVIAIRYVIEKIFKTKKSKNPLELIPGLKKTHPKYGNLLDVKDSGSLHDFLAKLHKTYGDIATFYWEDKIVVSICSHDTFKCIQKLFDRPPIIFSNWNKFPGENSLMYCNGEECLERRKEYDKSFQHRAIINYIVDIERAGKDLLDELKQQGSPIKSITQTCFRMAVKSILKSCLMPSKNDEVFYEDIISLYKDVFHGIENRYVKGQTFADTDDEEIRFQNDSSKLFEIIRKLINERMKLLENRDEDSDELLLIDRIILYYREINKDLIENESMTFMIAGFHTTGNALAWCIYYLSINKQCQDKLYEEISSKRFQLTNTMDCYKQILDMKYLRACIDESLRKSQLAPYGARVSQEDLLVKSYKIPANTPIIFALGVSFLDESIFKNNEQFNPDRFLTDDFPSLSFSPFGFAGKRKCPGERFSYLELSIWLIQLLEKYSFSLTNPNQKVSKQHGIVTAMVEDVSINFQER